MAVFKTSSSLALFLLVLGKILGIVGLVVAMYNRTLGGILLVLDGLLIVSAISMALRNGRQEIKQANDDKEVLKRLIREGALKQYVREVEEELAAEAAESTSKAAE